jgi:hypothetical protein
MPHFKATHVLLLLKPILLKVVVGVEIAVAVVVTEI